MADIDTLQRELLGDLRGLGERLRDEEFCGDLYRALSNRAWRRESGSDGHVSLSWRRAEDVVNELREGQGQGPLALAQTGGEGEVSPAVADELGGRGWTSEPLDTGRHDEAHDTSLPDPPPADQGQRALGIDSGAEERAAHDAAERERERTLHVQAPERPGEERGG
jgi:hypothetical protein